MVLTDLVVGMLGGGVLVEMYKAVAHRVAYRRQLNANALGTEVAALERTIAVLKENLEAEIARHDLERERLLERIGSLDQKIQDLNTEVATLRAENALLRAAGNSATN